MCMRRSIKYGVTTLDKLNCLYRSVGGRDLFIAQLYYEVNLVQQRVIIMCISCLF